MTTSIRDRHRVTPVTGIFAAAHGNHDTLHDTPRRQAGHQARTQEASTIPNESTVVTLGTGTPDQDVLVYDYEPRTKRLVLYRQQL